MIGVMAGTCKIFLSAAASSFQQTDGTNIFQRVIFGMYFIYCCLCLKVTNTMYFSALTILLFSSLSLVNSHLTTEEFLQSLKDLPFNNAFMLEELSSVLLYFDINTL